MLAGRELGHDPSVGSMDVYLGGNEVGKNATAVLDDGRRRLVTRALDPEDEHSLLD
jgi:hypothetical protein